MSSVGISARCTICTSEFHRNNIGALPCGHTFHFDCVVPWLKNAKSCPNCRARVSNEKLVIKQLFFDSEDASQSTAGERDYAAEAEELAMKLQKERDEHFKTKEEQRKVEGDRDSFRDKFNRINTKYQKELPKLQSDNAFLRMRLEEINEMEVKLKEFQELVRVSDFYKLVIGNDANIDDPKIMEKLQKYLSAGEVDSAKFIVLLKRQMEEVRKQSKKFHVELQESEKQRRSQIIKEKKLQDAINKLTTELNETRAAKDMGSPFNPKLKPFLDRTPPKRISMGFNQTIDLDEDVVNSALRKPLRKVPKRQLVDFDDIPSDRISMNPSKSAEIPLVDLNDTLNDSDLALPAHLLERVKAGPSRKLTNPMGAVPSAAMRALSNMENQNASRSLAPKPVKMMKKAEAGKAAANKKPTISSFFKKTQSTNDIIDLD